MNVIEFGRYWKGSGLENTPIHWLVLEETDELLFVISEQAIGVGSFDFGQCNWANNTARTWLNHVFLQQAFSEAERAAILEKELITAIKPEPFWEGYRCPDEELVTKDRVFLLSQEEVLHFFPTQQSRVLPQDDADAGIAWWLRNSGLHLLSPMAVFADGNYGYWAETAVSACGIRPAVYIRRDCFDRIPLEGQLELGSMDS